MNRAHFIQKFGLAVAGSFVLPQILLAQNNKFKGNPPIISKTPWGQKVIYDRYTYADMKKAEWILAGKNQEEIAELGKQLQAAIENKQIKFSKGPVKIVDGVWLLDVDGQQGIYLIAYKSGLILVDPGMESNSSKIVQQVKELGYSMSDIKHVLLTHCHVDHSHSASYWLKRGAEIHIHKTGENPIRAGNEMTAWYLIKGEERVFPKLTGIITTFHDGDRLDFGDLQIHVIHTPGHTPDSCCFYFKREEKNILIGGDTLFHNGKHGWMGHPYSDYGQYLKSFWKIKNFAVGGTVHNEPDKIMVRNSIEFDVLLPGHAAISLENVTRDIEKSIEIMSYTIQQRQKGVDYQWTEPYTFFAERKVNNRPEIEIEYR